MKRLTGCLKIVGIGLTLVLLMGAGLLYVAARRSIFPDNINMSSDGMGDMAGMDMGNMNMGTPSADATPITKFVAPDAPNAPVKLFTLTAETATIDLGNGKTESAYTYNGTVPGPELRVQQDDMVVVTLVNKLPVSTTIHWHGISVPNAEDGVAGLTQDAVKPGESYTYRFVANYVGTYWYHSHQETSIQLPIGLFGAIIVEPNTPTVHYDRDYTVFLHEWDMQPHTFTGCHGECPETLTVNGRRDQIALSAKRRETVRLRIANSANETHFPVLVGVPFQVIALDGHDLNGPTPLTNVSLPIGSAQRTDLSFVMPAGGSVALIDADTAAVPVQHPMAVFGDGQDLPGYPTNATPFDFTNYGTPTTDTVTLNTHFDEQYNMVFGEQPGFYDGALTLTFPINGQTYPSIPSINVKLGDVVKIHMDNEGLFRFDHSMHLHGHYFIVLAHNGKPLTGSPVHLDTILVNHGETYDVAFVTNNPGLWMLHCHMVEHDMHGMDMMVNYPNIYTPYSIGTTSGNNPF
jgi:FtsP/CotA-like multicopper oxidase with cupredoxin domain